MSALVERLNLTLQEAKDWLRLPRLYSSLTFFVLSPPAPSTLYFAIVNGLRAEFNSGATPTADSVATGLAAAIHALGIVGLDVQNLGSGRVSLALSPSTSTFDLYLGPGIDFEPVTADDAILFGLKTAAVALADEYINNPFAQVDAEGVIIPGTEEPIPAPVRVGVLQLLGFLYAENRLSVARAGTSPGSTGPVGPIKSKKVGDLSVDYATGDDMTGDGSTFRSEASKVVGLPIVVTSILDLYRLIPGWRVARAARPGYSPLGDMNDNLLIGEVIEKL